jgi:hypothetical protein
MRQSCWVEKSFRASRTAGIGKEILEKSHRNKAHSLPTDSFQILNGFQSWTCAVRWNPAERKVKDKQEIATA